MDGKYDICLGRRVVGSALVQRQGLYYHFSCRCRFDGDDIYTIAAICGDKQETLGVCVPMGKGFGVETKVPAKKLGTGEFRLCAEPKHAAPLERFVPIRPEEPFDSIMQLPRACLCVRNGQVGIMVRAALQPDHCSYPEAADCPGSS